MPTDPQILVFGDFELDEARFELRRSGRAVALRATPFRLLQRLVRERGRVVPKEELLESVWPDVTVSDTALSSALKAVRQALGDDGKQQRWIQTLRKRGIRFVAGAASAAVPTVPPRAPPAQRSEASLATLLALRSAAHRRRPFGRVRLGGERGARGDRDPALLAGRWTTKSRAVCRSLRRMPVVEPRAAALLGAR